MVWIFIGKHPVEEHNNNHANGINSGHHLPTIGNNQGGRYEFSKCGASVAGTKNTHRKSLSVIVKPFRCIGNANRKGCSCNTNKKSK